MSFTRKLNVKGRRIGARPFVMLENWVFDSEAFRTLKSGPRALLWEVIRKHNGANNGRIGFSQRAMSAAINVADRETVAGYVRELVARGFIKAHRRGSFNMKVSDRRASEWELTMYPVGTEPATKDFMRWKQAKIDGTEKPALGDGKADPAICSDVPQHSNGPEIPSLTSRPTADPGPENPSTYTSVAIAVR